MNVVDPQADQGELAIAQERPARATVRSGRTAVTVQVKSIKDQLTGFDRYSSYSTPKLDIHHCCTLSHL